MNRSTGVTVSAIFVFIGSALVLLFACFMAFAALFVPSQPAQPPFVRHVLVGLVAVYFAFAIWGIASGVGLLLLKKWARISILVFSGILVLCTLPALVFVPFLPMPQTADSPGEFVLAFKIGMTLFYGVFAAVGGGWLYFFNRQTVKKQFLGPEEASGQEGSSSKRPLSITIIGSLLVVTGFLAVPFTLFFRYPMLLMGFLLTGWPAVFSMLSWCVIQGIAGVGLLRLRSWGRTLAICLFSFGLVNVSAIVSLPGATARFVQVNADSQVRMRAMMGLPETATPVFSPAALHSFMWFGVSAGALVTILQLWFVVTRKQAFSRPTEVSALPS